MLGDAHSCRFESELSATHESVLRVERLRWRGPKAHSTVFLFGTREIAFDVTVPFYQVDEEGKPGWVRRVGAIAEELIERVISGDRAALARPAGGQARDLWRLLHPAIAPPGSDFP